MGLIATKFVSNTAAGRGVLGAQPAGSKMPAMPSKPNDIARETDVYFRKTKEIVRRFGDREATYAVFLRRPVISTPRLMVDFLESAVKTRRTKIKIDLNYREGEMVGAGEPLAYLTGSLEHLVDLETLYLQKLGPACVAAYN